MAISTSLNRLPRRDWSPAAARHLLWRVGFGGSPAEVAALWDAGLDRAVEGLLGSEDNIAGTGPDVDPDVIRPLSTDERRAARAARQSGDEDALREFRSRRIQSRREDRAMHVRLQSWWLQRMIQTPRPLEEKLTLLWHGHFATRHRNVRDAYLMYQQNQMMRTYGAKSFSDLAQGVVRDPAMLKFLNNDRNNARKPNENLARELMELFTLGEGQYRERDIREGARSLTGYHVNDNDFSFRRRAHDGSSKTIFGRTGPFDGDDFVDIILARKRCARFVAFKIYRYFVLDIDEAEDRWPPASKRVIDQLSDRIFRDRYQLQPLLKDLFRSRHFYDSAVVGKKIKSPAELLAGTIRAMKTPYRNPRMLREAMRRMGQQLFDPPSVAGWDGGSSWINTATLFARQNLCLYLITGEGSRRGGSRHGDEDYDPMALLGVGDRHPTSVANHLVDVYLGSHVPAVRRVPLLDFMTRNGQTVTADTLVSLLVLICAMPEYQLC